MAVGVKKRKEAAQAQAAVFKLFFVRKVPHGG